MLIRAGFEIAYECPAATPLQLLLNVHPSRRADLASPDRLSNDRGAPMSQYADLHGNACTRLVAPEGRTTLSTEFLIRDSGVPDPVTPSAKAAKVEDLPNEVMIYLLGSRYCETDRLSDLAWSLFDATPQDWSRVQAIVDYVHDRISFGYEHARPTKTAFEAHEERKGVCRDFAHLAITLCRCMNIPARYCTGYLGDIGVPPIDAPMDFSAWFETYLDGDWRTFDARHNTPRIGRVPIAYGRDAAETAITTAYGVANLAHFQVRTEQVDEALGRYPHRARAASQRGL